MKYLIVKFKTWFIWIMLLISVILSPIIGKGVENTTKALLPGLSSKEQIETVADIVDVNKIEVEEVLAAQQAVIDEQNTKLAEQEELINKHKAEVATVSAVVVKNKDCSADVAKYCIEPWQSDKSKFDKLITNSIENCLKNENWNKNKCEEYVLNNYQKKFNLCQSAIDC